jgi:hypothetical protein
MAGGNGAASLKRCWNNNRNRNSAMAGFLPWLCFHLPMYKILELWEGEMRLKISLLFAFLISSTLFVSIVSADWANMFVVNDGKMIVISEEHLDPKQV